MTEPVTLRFAGLPGARIELAGDFPCWRVRHPFVESSPGEHRIELQLPPGVYRYKFVADGERWLVDPAAPAWERVEGVDNGVLVVGGTRPPLFFAPDSRHVGLFADGRLLLHVEVEADAPVPASVWLEVEGERWILPLTEVLVRGHRRLLRAAAVVPGEPCRLGFPQGPDFAVPPRRPAVSVPPAWLAGAVLYGIFVDRWHRAPGSPRDPRTLSRQVPSTPSVLYGGDLDGVAGELDYLAGLGVDALVLTPVQYSASAHRYDGIDLAAVDPRLGGEAALRRLLAAAHARGLKVVVDVSLTHVSDRHPAFRDLLARQEGSPYRDWFQVRRFPVRRGDPETFAHYYGCPDLPWLRLTSGPAREHAIGAALRLVDLGVDGLRLDAMEEAPPDVWAELRARARARNPDLLLLGEIVTDRLAAFAGEQGVDVATDFRDRETLLAFLATSAIDAREAYERLVFAAFRTGACDFCLRLSFLDTHDTARFLSRAGSPRRLRLALALLLFLPSTVWITYGTELDLAARQPEPPLDEAWPERLPMPVLPPPPGETLEVLRELCALRRELREDGAGPLTLVAARGRLLVVERQGRSRRWRLALNAASEPEIAEELSAPRLAIGCCATGRLPGESARVTWAAGSCTGQAKVLDFAISLNASLVRCTMSTAELITDLALPPISVQELTSSQIRDLRLYASVWLGDFNIPGFGAGNVRIGPFYNPDRPEDPRSTAFLFDCNLVDLQRLTAAELANATLVLGSRDFQPQPGSRFSPDGGELALARAVEPGYRRHSRGASDWIPETKLLGVAVPTSELLALSAGQGLSFYARLATDRGVRWINRDGVPYRNFDLPEEIILQHSSY